MSKVTSKLQVTIPKALAERYGISPGQDVQWLQAGEAIRVVPQGAQRARAVDRGKHLLRTDEVQVVRRRPQLRPHPRHRQRDRQVKPDPAQRQAG